jgi:heat shock protein HslJ
MNTRLRAACVALLAVASLAVAAPVHAGDAPAPRGDGRPSQDVNVVGTWRSERIKVKQIVTFAKDGTVSGNGGCNSFSGTYKVRSWFITISPLAATLRLCDDATMHAEQKFLSKLQSATRVDYDPNCGPPGLVFDTPDGLLWVVTYPPDPDFVPLPCTGNARPFR